MTISPNPSDGNFNIELKHVDLTMCTVTLKNSLGKEITDIRYTTANNQIHFESRNLEKGLYILEIYSPATSYKKKIIIGE
jgi:hypothetical protein